MDGLTGYLRSDGRWGLRNHVLVLPLHLAAGAAAERIAASVDGAVSVVHDWTGEGSDEDVARVGKVLVGFAGHPNVSATLCIGLGEDDATLAERARERGARVEFLSLEAGGGTAGTIERGLSVTSGLAAEAARLQRRTAPPSAICLGLECGGSDGMSGITANPALGVASDLLVEAGGTSVLAETSELVGAEHLLAERAVSAEVAKDIIEMIERFERAAASLGVDLRGGQPGPGNMKGGLTTIEEKSLGAAKKGGKAPIQSVLEYAEAPGTLGLHVMDTPGNDIEQMVGMVAAGCNIVAFTTGRGTPTGSPVAPCLKIATNSDVFRRMRDDLDLNAGEILDGTASQLDMGRRILAALAGAASGLPTASERHGNAEFAISRVAPRAAMPTYGTVSRI